MKRQNKKAIAPLIATVLLIVIVIAAAAIVWTIVVPLIRLQTETAQACMNTMGMTIDPSWTCWSTEDLTKDDSGGAYLQIKIARDNKDFDLKGVIIKTTSDNGNTVTITLKDGDKLIDLYDEPKTVSLPGILEEKVYKLSIEELGFDPDFDPTQEKITAVEIAPIVLVGATEKACDVTSSITVDSCEL